MIFLHMNTYAWIDTGKALSSDTRINNDQIKARVRVVVKEHLIICGFTKTDTETAGFRVSWHGIIEKKLQVDAIDHFNGPYGYGSLYCDPFWGGSAFRSSTVREYEVDTLSVDILDPVQHKLFWRGSGRDRLGSGDDPEKSIRKINKAVEVILKDFPPTEKY